MARYSAKRIVGFIPVLLIGSVLVWLMIYLVPGDPALVRLGPDASPAQIAAERRAMGLDRPVFVQYVDWLGAVLHGDLGRSSANGDKVSALIGRSFPVTINLAVAGLVVALVIGLFLGVRAAVNPRGLAGKFLNVYTSLALGVPTFWVGMLLVWLFAIRLRLLPSSGYESLLSDPVQYLRHMLLPAVTLGVYGSGIVARFVAAAMTEALAQDYIWTARAKGVSEPTVLRRHGLRNALIPVTTVIGLQFGVLLGGAVVIEAVFNLPGMGRLLLSSVTRRDYSVVQAEVLLILIAVGTINVIVDIMYGVLDPRIRR
jgi:peptide/nickel transport system permease protein